MFLAKRLNQIQDIIVVDVTDAFRGEAYFSLMDDAERLAVSVTCKECGFLCGRNAFYKELTNVILDVEVSIFEHFIGNDDLVCKFVCIEYNLTVLTAFCGMPV